MKVGVQSCIAADYTRSAALNISAQIVHTFRVHGILRSLAALAMSGALGACCQTPASAWQSAVDRAVGQSPNATTNATNLDARIIVLDIASGRLLASHRLADATRTVAAPGSTLKPLVLYSLIRAGRWNPANRVACNRQLVVAGHRLACTHPLAPPFDAQEALTWSCNSYFAAVARSLEPGELGRLLRPTGLLGLTGLARQEAAAEFREPNSPDSEQLALLGVDGVRVTPLELAAAYRWLAIELAAHSDSDAAQVVRAGLEDSASFGMAGQASLGGVAVLGKTGTADGASSPRTHGWFVGLAPARNPQVVIAVFLPAGRGADAAHVAGDLLANAPINANRKRP
ncbi:MAG: penicillin-binding transpeptidase domain-containing protein [Terracidiphilus sp.]|jgi:cell division protein FtsI/penicillin-binding protein 2